MSEMIPSWLLIALVVLFSLVVAPAIAAAFLRNVEAGTIRLVSWLHGGTVIYRGPGKSKEIPLLTIGTTISSKVINVDLDITDQTADVDAGGTPCPIKVRVLASAIVSVGDTDTLIKTAANRFFSKSDADQISTLTDLLSSSGRRAINLLTHNQLFSAKATPAVPLLEAAGAGARAKALAVAITPVRSGEALAKAASQGEPEAGTIEDEDDPLAVIIRKACSRELTDLGLIFNSLNIKVVQSEVAEARRRQSAAEAQANSEIVAALQSRRAKEAQLEAERIISDKQRELAQTKAANAALIAQSEAKRQEAAGVQRGAELDATLIAEAKAGAMRVRLEAEAAADAEAIRIRRIADATAESIQKVNQAIQQGGESYFRYRQIELLPQIAPTIAHALARAKLVTIAAGEGGAAQVATDNITSVIQTVLAAQLVGRAGLLEADASEAPVANGAAVADSPLARRMLDSAHGSPHSDHVPEHRSFGCRRDPPMLKRRDRAELARTLARVRDDLTSLVKYAGSTGAARLLRDAERRARRQPAGLLGGTFLLGLALLRILRNPPPPGADEPATPPPGHPLDESRMPRRDGPSGYFSARGEGTITNTPQTRPIR